MIILFTIIFLGALISFIIAYNFIPGVVYSESFYWDTNNCINGSNSQLIKIRHLPIWYVKHNVNYRHPKEHPNYKKFKRKIKKIKLGQTVNKI
jgi:hypothetical protein